MKVDTNYLVSFLPGPLVERLEVDPQAPHDWSARSTEVVAVQMDVSGFSTLSEKLTRGGSAGTEEIVALLDRYFAELVATIDDYGGHTVGFGGDSVVSIWHPETGEDLEAAALAASGCALTVQERIGHLATEEIRALGFRIGVGVGTAMQMHLGGHGGRWLFTIAGPAMIDTGRAMQAGAPGRVAVSPRVVDMIESRSALSVRPDGHGLLEAVRAEMDSGHRLPTLSAQALDTAASYVPLEILDAITEAGPEWTAEHRPTTALLVNLPDLDVATRASQAKLQQAVRLAQEHLERFDGFMSGVMADEKGITLIAGFGLPHHAAGEGAIKAIATGRLLQEKLRDMRLTHGIGLASGRTFCSAYGSDVFRQYTFIGPSVNLAARLMVAAQNEVLCDHATMRASRRRVHFSQLRPVQVKGAPAPVEVYRPDWDLSAGLDEPSRSDKLGHLLGRDDERAAIAARLGSVVAGAYGAIVVEGEAGIGKTALATEGLRIARSLGTRVLLASADPVGGGPYHVWRSILNTALDLEDTYDPLRRADRLRKALSSEPELVELASLLNPILDLGLPETDVVLNMTPQGRRERTADVIAFLLGEFSPDESVLIAVDDVQWMDDASWHVLERVSEQSDHLALLLMARPFEAGPPGFYEALTEAESTLYLRLDRIDTASSRRLAAEALGVDQLPEPIAHFIGVKGEGHPLFTEELAYHLRDEGYIDVSGSQARLTVPVDSIEDIDLPDTVQELIVGRIERLTPAEQMTIKVASVIGGTIHPNLVASLHPDLSEEAVRDHLRRLVDLDLLRSLGDRYRFKHVITRDSVYERIPASLRRELHERLARHLEDNSVDENAYATLAHHWEKAGNLSRSLDYWEASGATALVRGAAQDATHFFEKCIQQFETHQIEEVAVERRAYWESQLGDACGDMGRVDDGIQHDRQALEMLGFPLPKTAVGETWRLIRAVLGQLSTLMSDRSPDEVRVGPSRQAAHILSKLSPAHYYRGELRRWALVSLEAVNRAEGSGDPGIAGIAYISLGTLAGVLRLRKLAFRYFEMARTPLRLSASEGQTGGIAAGITPQLNTLNGVGADLAKAVVLIQGKGDHLVEVLDLLTGALASSRRLEAHQYTGAILAVRGFAHSLHSPRADALADLREVAELGRRRNQPQHETWGLALQVPLLVDTDRMDEAIEISDRAEGVAHLADPISQPIHLGSRSRVLAVAGRSDQALQVVEAALTHLKAIPIFLYATAFANLALAMLELDDKNRFQLGWSWKRMILGFRLYAWMLPFASDHAAYFAALGQERRGHGRRAKRGFEEALRLAETSGHRWFMAWCHERLAELESANPKEKRRHLDSAEALYRVLQGRRAA